MERKGVIMKTRTAPKGFFSANKQLWELLYFPVALLYLEVLFKLFYYVGSEWYFGLTLLFTLTGGLLCSLLTHLFSPKVNRIVSSVLLCFFTLWFCTQQVYTSFFGTPLIVSSVFQGAGDMVETFFGTMMNEIFQNLHAIVLYFVPFVGWLILTSKRGCFACEPVSRRTLGALLLSWVTCWGLSVWATAMTGHGENGMDGEQPYAQYFATDFTPSIAVRQFGVMTDLRLDVQHMLIGGMYGVLEVAPVEPPPVTSSEEETLPPDEPAYDTSPNILDIDFESLIANETDSTLLNMHKYFSTVTPTNKNAYTGLYKDCNLIYMTVEALSYLAVDPVLTPTLYKLVNEGFCFTNAYTPLWGVSTSDGEYVTCQSLIPKTGVWSFYRSGEQKNWLPFVLGHQFAAAGYPTPLAYHNHKYSYYNRDISHPNMGYDYYGRGNGLDVKGSWPESDLEMMEKTIPQILQQEKFHVYYMTVSGHMDYEYAGNAMSSKHRKLVEATYPELPTACKAYLACNIEFDRALQYLLEQLELAGKLDNTVIAFGPDHYPYGLSNEDISAFIGHEVETNFELYKSVLCIWKNGQPHEVIDDPVCNMDLLPTVSNLFGLKYDSRLLMGRDIFSDSMPLVVFENRSWITDKAMYNAKTGEVTQLTDELVDEEYVKSVKRIVSAKFKYSTLILEEDYYAAVVPRPIVY